MVTTRGRIVNRRDGVWHIDKQIRGIRICESTGERKLENAEAYLARKIEELRQASVYGVRPLRTFGKAAEKYLKETRKRSLERDERALKEVLPYIGSLPLNRIHMGTLDRFIKDRLKEGKKHATINRTLGVVRHILNLAARLWRDEHGLTWLETAPLIQLLKLDDARKPYPLSWFEQSLLFQELPAHLEKMALFKVNTGTREQEVCCLRWDWEVQVPELQTVVFIVPKEFVKNGDERLIVLNKVALSIVEGQRKEHGKYVFSYKGEKLGKINTSAWKRARVRAAKRYVEKTGKPSPDGFGRVRVHDLKHTFGRRLRSAGVSFEDRQDLLGHKSGRITTHYSAAELVNLLAAANSVCSEKSRKSPALVLLRSNATMRGMA